MRGDRLSYWAISLSKEYRSHLIRPSYNRDCTCAPANGKCRSIFVPYVSAFCPQEIRLGWDFAYTCTCADGPTYKNC